MPNVRINGLFDFESGAERTAFLVSMLVGVAACLFCAPHSNLFPFDDTYITFRYSYNVAHGFGLVWNPGGPHTEGYTNFLYVLLLAPATLITKDIVVFAQVIGTLAMLLSGVLCFRLSADLVASHSATQRAFAGAVASIVLFIDSLTWSNAFTGMETALFCCSVLTTFYFVRRASLSGRLVAPFVAAVVATLIRPEGALLGIVVAIALVIASRDVWGVATTFLLAFVLPLALYAAWKYLYFGDLLPNSYYVKVASAVSADEGKAYVLRFLGRRILFWLCAAGGLLVFQRSPLALPQVLFSILLLLFFSRTAPLQGDYFRFLLPGYYAVLPLIGAVVSFVVAVSPRVSIAAIVLVAAQGYRMPHAYKEWSSATDGKSVPYMNRYREVARVLHHFPGRDSVTFAWSDVGILPYYSDMNNIDLVGLNTTEIAHAASTDAVVAYLARTSPQLIFVPLDMARDSQGCRHAIDWGHGTIGRIFPKFFQLPEFKHYQPVALFDQHLYSVLILADDRRLKIDSTQAYFQRVSRALSYFQAPPSCLE